MASLQTHYLTPRIRYRFGSGPPENRESTFYWRFTVPSVGRVRVSSSHGGGRRNRGGWDGRVCRASSSVGTEKAAETEEENERPPFDINLAVVLAGFAFEAYRNPPENIGRQEIDAADCKTVYLSESFVREIYDGQLFIKLKKGLDLPIMDPWGTSDPYVVMQLDGQVAKSKIKWGKKEPTWNEDFTFNIRQPATKTLEVATWDANLITPHKRMGNAGINLDSLCDGDLHEVLVELEGMGGGGKLLLEVKYKTFDEIDDEKKWWKLSFVSEFLRKNGFESALKRAVGTEAMPARQFVEYAFGQLKTLNDAYISKDHGSKTNDMEVLREDSLVSDRDSERESSSESSFSDTTCGTESNLELSNAVNGSLDDDEHATELLAEVGGSMQSDKHFWKKFADNISQTVVQKLDLPVSLDLKWDGFDSLKRFGLQLQKIAEAGYVDSGLAIPGQNVESGETSGPPQSGYVDSGLAIPDQGVESEETSGPPTISKIQSSIPELKKATEDLLKQTDSILGAFVVMSAAISNLNKEVRASGKGSSESENLISSLNGSALDEKKAEEMRALFSTAESAMEAWAMLATSVGHPSFIKSEFEKLCFLDNETTDTQVAIWRDSARRRLVVAFRGTEQSKWKDLRTDLMLVPAGLNPERIGGDFKQEVQVHSGFLSAYDSVRIRIISVIKKAIGYIDDEAELPCKWHIYVTGHSLGGALATLHALELQSTQLAKRGAISVTMYNFGSPRVGNRRFAEVYNKKVKDSWRVVNHRDIIPTVPRMMGYCHVAQPVYLATGKLKEALETLEPLKDGYEGDVIGEYTPDVLVNEYMKGEKELVEKILQTEINIFRAIRDGSALMQHMEDFYYITLLENVRSNYRTPTTVASNEPASSNQLKA